MEAALFEYQHEDDENHQGYHDSQDEREAVVSSFLFSRRRFLAHKLVVLDYYNAVSIAASTLAITFMPAAGSES